MFSKESFQIWTPNLFLSLDEEDYVHWESTFFPEGLGHAEDVGEDLSLVISRTARMDAPILDSGLKGRCSPTCQRLRRLHVVVAVDQHGSLRWIVR